ncbi:hypothetical protein DSO57_1036519 [Entomophthora muscae]|uniref:Uncharacterized protein n=1 Tax=Entomophthora muscae TaxID=34485 RepID=A0ACC2TLN5_9FUNG|nr:hypothetical protein DSO57_1036519 [Entomophthora muscae]
MRILTLSYLLKLGPIIWWAMPVPASAPTSPEGASQYSWYPDSIYFPEKFLNERLGPDITADEEKKCMSMLGPSFIKPDMLALYWSHSEGILGINVSTSGL